jgi:hypothetical protein
MIISGQPKYYMLRDKNGNFVVDFIFDTLPQIVDFALKSYHKDDPQSFLSTWIEDNEDEYGDFPGITWESVHNNYSSEIDVGINEMIFMNDDAFVICPLDIYQMVQKQYERFDKELSYHDLWIMSNRK